MDVPIFLKGWERRFLWVLIPLSVLVTVFSVYGERLPLQARAGWEYFDMAAYFITRSTQGILYVYLGMWISRHRDRVAKFRLWKGILPALNVTAAEAFLMYRFSGAALGEMRINITVCVWSVLILLLLLRMKGSGIQKYHRFVALFSGLLYFLHIVLADILENWLHNALLCLLAVLGITLGRSLLVVWLTGRKHRGQTDGLQAEYLAGHGDDAVSLLHDPAGACAAAACFCGFHSGCWENGCRSICIHKPSCCGIPSP